jgi:hypothetical protein
VRLQALTAAALVALGAASAQAQDALVWAGANDAPNTLINGTFNGTTLTYAPEVPTGGTTTGLATTLAFNQTRLFPSTTGCAALAITNNGTNSVSIFTVNGGTITPVTGSPFVLGAGVQSIAWAPDGGALYVPLAVTGASQVITLTVTCTAGSLTVTNAGPVTLAGFNLLRDGEVIGTGAGSHLCVSGTTSNNMGCFAIDGTTRLPSTTAVNTVAATNVRGMRIHRASGCGVAGLGGGPTVQAFSVTAGGTIALTNTAAHLSAARYGAMSQDGAFAAWGGLGDDIALYNVTAPACTIAQAGTNSLGSATPLIEYLEFDQLNRVYVADSLLNQIRVFQASPTGFGTALSTTTTNHGTVNAPAGIVAALLTRVPVELQGFDVK